MNRTTRAVALALSLAASLGLWAEVKTITGRVSCSMCRGKHQMGKDSDAECVRACVKYGAKYVVISGDEVYVVSVDPKQFAYYADRVVTIRGEVDHDRIVKIEAISVEK